LRVLDALRGFKRGRWITEIEKELGVSDRQPSAVTSVICRTPTTRST